MSKKHRNKKKRTLVKRSGKKTKKKAVKRSGKKKKKATFKKSRIVIAIIITLIGLVGAGFGTWSIINPRISVRTGEPHDPNNPVLTPFVIRNDGHLAIRDVKCSNAMRELNEKEMDIQIIGLGHFSNRFSDLEQVADVIYPGEEFSTPLYFSNLKHHQFGKMDVAIVISFRPIKWLSWRKESSVRFITKGEDGQWHWQPMPFNK